MRRTTSARLTALALCLWGSWSLACYESNDDRCVPGQARCEDNGEYSWSAKTCVENASGPHYFAVSSCPKRTSTCKIGRDASGSPRAFCAQGDERDERCARGEFGAQCTEDGWVRCSDGYVSTSSLCPFGATCELGDDGVGGCSEATEPSPSCVAQDDRHGCDGATIAVRCDAGYETARYPCSEGSMCDPVTGGCRAE